MLTYATSLKPNNFIKLNFIKHSDLSTSKKRLIHVGALPMHPDPCHFINQVSFGPIAFMEPQYCSEGHKVSTYLNTYTAFSDISCHTLLHAFYPHPYSGHHMVHKKNRNQNWHLLNPTLTCHFSLLPAHWVACSRQLSHPSALLAILILITGEGPQASFLHTKCTSTLALSHTTFPQLPVPANG